MTSKPLAFTCGDPAGVGPEIIAAWLAAHADLVCDELNVKQFEICREPDRYITRAVLPDLKKLGPRLGKDLPKARDAITKADAGALLAALHRDGRATPGHPRGWPS